MFQSLQGLILTVSVVGTADKDKEFQSLQGLILTQLFSAGFSVLFG
jgi:hypothetical protein